MIDYTDDFRSIIDKHSSTFCKNVMLEIEEFISNEDDIPDDEWCNINESIMNTVHECVDDYNWDIEHCS